MESFSSSHLGLVLARNITPNKDNLGGVRRRGRPPKQNNPPTPVNFYMFDKKKSVQGYTYLLLRRPFKNRQMSYEHKVKMLDELLTHLSIDENSMSVEKNNEGEFPYINIKNSKGQIVRFMSRHNGIFTYYYDDYKNKYVGLNNYSLDKHVILSSNRNNNHNFNTTNSNNITEDIAEGYRRIDNIEDLNNLNRFRESIGLNETKDLLRMDRDWQGKKVYTLTFSELSEVDVELAYSYIRGLLIQ